MSIMYSLEGSVSPKCINYVKVDQVKYCFLSTVSRFFASISLSTYVFIEDIKFYIYITTITEVSQPLRPQQCS